MAKKFGARLQAAQGGDAPILVRVETQGGPRRRQADLEDARRAGRHLPLPVLAARHRRRYEAPARASAATASSSFWARARWASSTAAATRGSTATSAVKVIRGEALDDESRRDVPEGGARRRAAAASEHRDHLRDGRGGGRAVPGHGAAGRAGPAARDARPRVRRSPGRARRDRAGPGRARPRARARHRAPRHEAVERVPARRRAREDPGLRRRAARGGPDRHRAASWARRTTCRPSRCAPRRSTAGATCSRPR